MSCSSELTLYTAVMVLPLQEPCFHGNYQNVCVHINTGVISQ